MYKSLFSKKIPNKQKTEYYIKYLKVKQIFKNDAYYIQ